MYKNTMLDETAIKMYESARDRLRELLRQEIDIKDQISHWGPVVEQLARLSGETVDPEIASRINELKRNAAGESGLSGAGQEMGRTGGIRWVFRQPCVVPPRPHDGRAKLADMGNEVDS